MTAPGALRYAICAVRPAAAAAGEPDAGLLYPLPGTVPDAVALEPRDGDEVRQLRAREVAVTVRGADRPLLRADDIRAQVYVSDARVAIACTKYDRGGGWIGGPLALTLNVVSWIRAARRRRGLTLVGHVRYPWLHGVYARGRAGRWGSELLRLEVEGEAEGQRLRLDIGLARGESATATAAEIIRRAARFRLEHDEDATPAQTAELEALAQLAALEAPEGDERFAGRDLPTSWPPTVRSARLGSPAAPDAAATLGRQPRPAAAPSDDVAVVLRDRAPAAGDDLGVTLRRPPPRG